MQPSHVADEAMEWDLTNYTYIEKSCTSSVSGDNFSGTKEFQWNLAPGQVWIPNRSYFKISVSLKGASVDGLLLEAPEFRNGIALTDNVCSNLFHTVVCRIGDEAISSQKNSSSRADMVKVRLGQSNAIMKTAGYSSSMIESHFGKRQMVTTGPDTIGFAGGYRGGVDTVWEARDIAPKLSGTVLQISSTNAGLVTVDYGGPDDDKIDLFVNSDFKVYPGDTFVISGIPYTVSVGPTDATQIAKRQFSIAYGFGAGIAQTTDAYRRVYRPQPQKSQIDLIWQPRIGIMECSDPIAAAAFRFELSCDTNYKKRAVQSFSELKAGVAAINNYDFVVNDIRFYAAVANTPMRAEKKLQLTLCEMEIASKPLQRDNLTEFKVPLSSYGFALFTQSGKANASNIVAPSKFKQTGKQDEQVTQLQLTYGGVSKPTTNISSSYTDNTNGLLQRYRDTLDNVGALYNEGGTESFVEWLERGPLFYFDWTKPQNDRDTNLQVKMNLAVDPEPQSQLYVVSLFKRIVEIDMDKGYIKSVVSYLA